MSEKIVASLLRWWPILIVIAAGLIAWGETRYQVQHLVNDKQADRKQWELIRENREALTDHAGRLRAIEKHVTPEAIQEWGALKQQFREDHVELQRHLRDHRP